VDDLPNAPQQNNSRTGSIIVAGDVAIDWLAYPIPPRHGAEEPGAPPPNWHLRGGTRMVPRRGGALLLTDFLRHTSDRSVIGPLVDNLETCSPETHLHSLIDLKPDEAPASKRSSFIVERLRGFYGPTKTPLQPALERADVVPEILVLDDAGNGFRDVKASWSELRTPDRL
jgi:hypothetical protein